MKSYWFVSLHYSNCEESGKVSSVIKSKTRDFPFYDLERLQRKRGDYPYVITFYRRIKKREFLEYWRINTDTTIFLDDEIKENFRRFAGEL